MHLFNFFNPNTYLATPFDIAGASSYVGSFTAVIKNVIARNSTNDNSLLFTGVHKTGRARTSDESQSILFAGTHKINRFLSASISVLNMFEGVLKSFWKYRSSISYQAAMSDEVKGSAKDTDVISNDANLTGETIVMRKIEGTEYGHGE